MSSIPATFPQAIVATGMVALAASALVAAVRTPAMRELCAKFRRMSRIGQAVVLAAVIILVAYSGTKPSGAPQLRSLPAVPAPPPFALVEARTNGVAFAAASTNAVVSETILRRGVSEGGEWIEWDGSGFLWGTNEVHRAYAFPAGLSFGTMRRPKLGESLPDGTNVHALIALRTPLGIAPDANWHLLNAPSRFWHDTTPLGHVFTWENALLDRLAEYPATIQIETRRDGSFIYRYDFSQAEPTNSFATTVIGPETPNDEDSYIDLGNPPSDSPLFPNLNHGSAVYTVSSFHTHTPTQFRTGLPRPVGASQMDKNNSALFHMPGIVRDYLESPANSGTIPMGHPMGSASMLYPTAEHDRRQYQ